MVPSVVTEFAQFLFSETHTSQESYIIELVLKLRSPYNKQDYVAESILAPDFDISLVVNANPKMSGLAVGFIATEETTKSSYSYVALTAPEDLASMSKMKPNSGGLPFAYF